MSADDADLTDFVYDNGLQTTDIRQQTYLVIC